MKKFFMGASLLGALSFAQAQTGLNSSYFQVMQARALGPSTMSGRITAIEGALSEGQINLYVGTAGGGIWKSQNGGQSFAPIFDKYCQSIGALALEPGNPKVVYAGTGESNMRNTVSIGDGLYKTTDGGNNWQKLGLDSTEHIAKILLDPADKKTVYVAAPGPLWSSSAHRGLYKSTDAGKTWQKILYVNAETGCADLAIHPQKSNVLLASFWQFRRKPYSFVSGGAGSALYKSVDGGKTWNKLTKGLPEGELGRIVVTINPSQPSQVLAIVEAKEPGLYLSNDEGETWTKMASTNNITARPFYFSTLVYDPKDPKRVYRPAFDFAYSADGGKSWNNSLFGGVTPHADHHALWINPNNTDQLFLGTDGGVYYSINRGTTWQYLNSLPVGQFYHVSTDNQQPFNVYGGMQDNNSWMAPSSAPGGVTAVDWRVLCGGDGFWVQPSPLDPKIVFAEYQGGNMFRNDLHTGWQHDMKPKRQAGEEEYRWNWSTPIVTGASKTKSAAGKPQFNLYVAAQYLFRSRDEGRNWERISPDLTTNNKQIQQQADNSGGITGDATSAENHCTIFTLVQDPNNENNIWVGTDDGQLQHTSNGGKSWENLSANIWKTGVPKNAWISSIELSAANANKVYVTLENHMYGDHGTYVVVSTDAGKTWKRFVSNEFSGFAHVVREDPKNSQLLYLGTEMGLFFSLDGGANWMRSKYQNLPWYALVRDIKVQPQTNDLVIATHGRGIYILDGLKPLQEFKASDLEKAVTFYTPQPWTYNYGMGLPGPADNLTGWGAGNKADAPTFEYFLKERLNDAPKLEIYDASGLLLKELNGSNLKGLNKVYWNVDRKAPKVAKGGFTVQTSVQQAGVIGPAVPAGKYKVVLKVAGQTQEQWIEIKPNPAKGLTAQALQLRYQQALRLFKVEEDLAVLVDQMDSTLAVWDKASNLSDKDKNRKEALTNLRKEIIETNRKSIFFDEFKYRRRLSDLYVAAARSIEPFSATQAQSIDVMEKEFLDFRKKALALML